MMRTIWVFGLAVAISAALGCSNSSMMFSGGKMAAKMLKKDSALRVFVDGQQAKQNKLKKMIGGHPAFKVSKPVNVSPAFSYEVGDAEAWGVIHFTYVSIFEKVKDDVVSRPAFVITPVDESSRTVMRPATMYELAKLDPSLKVVDGSGKVLSGVTLKPKTKYQMVVTVTGKKSETQAVEFVTE
jgi:hypothetical protein